MKYVVALQTSFDASVGRITPGETYWVEDDKAERWLNAGLAKPGKAPPPAEPDDEGDEEPEEQDDEPSDPDELAAQAHKLHDDGLSERAIAQELGIARTRVHTLLAS